MMATWNLHAREIQTFKCISKKCHFTSSLFTSKIQEILLVIVLGVHTRSFFRVTELVNAFLLIHSKATKSLFSHQWPELRPTLVEILSDSAHFSNLVWSAFEIACDLSSRWFTTKAAGNNYWVDWILFFFCKYQMNDDGQGNFEYCRPSTGRLRHALSEDFSVWFQRLEQAHSSGLKRQNLRCFCCITSWFNPESSFHIMNDSSDMSLRVSLTCNIPLHLFIIFMCCEILQN